MGEAYAATAQAIPPGPQYVAMGHIHAPQTRAGRAGARPNTPARCSRWTSARPARQKRVVMVDAEPGRLAVARERSRSRAAGRSSARTGTWDAIEARADELAGALPRPHRDRRGDRHDAGRARARDLPVPREGPRAAAASASGRERLAEGAAPLGGAVRGVLPARARRGRAATTCSRSSATCWRRPPMRPLELTLEGFRSYRERRHVRLARSAARGHRRVRSARGSPRSWMRCPSRCTARRRRSSAPRSR